MHVEKGSEEQTSTPPVALGLGSTQKVRHMNVRCDRRKKACSLFMLTVKHVHFHSVGTLNRMELRSIYLIGAWQAYISYLSVHISACTGHATSSSTCCLSRVSSNHLSLHPIDCLANYIGAQPFRPLDNLVTLALNSVRGDSTAYSTA